eukprot:g4621.t1
MFPAAVPPKPRGLEEVLRAKRAHQERRRARQFRRGSSDAYRRRASSSALLSNKDLLLLAVERARRAIALDTQCNYREACKLYRRTIKYLKIVSRRAAAAAAAGEDANAGGTKDATHFEGLTPQASKLCEHWQLVYQQRLSGLEATRPRRLAPGLGHNVDDQHVSRTDDIASAGSSKRSASKQRYLPNRQSRMRRESLSKIPFIEDSVPREHCRRPPQAVERRPYWLLRLLRATINDGGFITPSVYASPLVWSQKGAKVSGLSAKISEYEKLYQILTTLQSVPLPSDGASWKTMYKRDSSAESFAAFDSGMVTFLEGLHEIQMSLHHSLSYVPKDRLKDDDAQLLVPLTDRGGRFGNEAMNAVPGSASGIEATRGDNGAARSPSSNAVESTGVGPQGSTSRKKGPMSRVLNKMSKIYDRTSNEVLTKRASGGDLQEYAAMIACISDRAQFLDGWLTFFEMPGCSGRHGAPPPGAAITRHTDNDLKQVSMIPNSRRLSRIHAQLKRAGNGLRDIVCIVVWKDLQELLERYMRKSRKAFNRVLEWDEQQVTLNVDDGNGSPLRTI